MHEAGSEWRQLPRERARRTVYRVDQSLDGRYKPRSKRDARCGQSLKGLNCRIKGPLIVVVSEEQDRFTSCNRRSPELGAIGDGAAVLCVRGQYMCEHVAVRLAIVAEETEQLGFDSPIPSRGLAAECVASRLGAAAMGSGRSGG